MRPAEARATPGRVRTGPGGSRSRARSRRSAEPAARPPRPDHLPVAGDVRRDHRHPGGHRFDEHDPEALLPDRGRREHVGGRVVPGKLRVGHGPQAQDPAANARRERAHHDAVAPVPRHEQPDVLELGSEHLERPHHDLETLLRIEAVHPQDLPAHGKPLDRRPGRANARTSTPFGTISSGTRATRRTKEAAASETAIAASIRRSPGAAPDPRAPSVGSARGTRGTWRRRERSLLGPRASRCSA